MNETLENTLEILQVLPLLALVFVVLGFLARVIAALFSKKSRSLLAAHPILHVVGFAISIVLLSGFLFPLSGSRVHTSARIMQAKNDLHNIVTASEAYHTEFGVMPTGGNAQIVEMLHGKNAKEIIFFDYPPKQLSPTHELLDPWGVPYRIGISIDGYLWAYSCGKNKRDDGGAPKSDDVVSW